MQALNNRQLLRVVGVLGVGFLTSGLLGLVRQAIVAAAFGTSSSFDAFIAAQRIPETLFNLVAGGALGSSFLPVFARLQNRDAADAERLTNALLSLIGLIGTALALVLALLAPFIMPLLIPNDSPAMQALAVTLTQIMLTTVGVFAVSGLCMAILNAHQSFWWPALAPSLYNIGLIIGALILARALPNADGTPNIYGLAWGAVLGALLHLAIQWPALRRLPLRWQFVMAPQAEGVRDVLLLMIPRLIAQLVVQINFTVNVTFTSGMLVGSRTALDTAWRLMFFALGVIGQSIGAAVFPTLSALAAQGDMDGYKARLTAAIRGVLFLALPALAALVLLGQPLIALLFERGEWSAESTQATAWALTFYALGIPAFALLEILSRAFYALEDTRTPVAVGVGAMVANIALSALFIQIIGDAQRLAFGPFGGLALANSLTTIIEAGVLWALLWRRIGGTMQDNAGTINWSNDALAMAARTSLAVIAMTLCLWLLRNVTASAPAWMALAVGGAVGGVVFFAAAYALRVEEVRAVPQMVLRRLKRQ
jgi:putative peptidoglycan lipid II flippase